jgi:hypothetical protein
MGKIKLFIIWMFAAVCLNAQSEQEDRTGILRAFATLSVGHTFHYNTVYGLPFYLHGALEYYVHPKISITGESYLDLRRNPQYLTPSFAGLPGPIDYGYKYHQNTFFGANYHWHKNKHDFYIGIQPGITFLRPRQDPTSTQAEKIGISPMASFAGGYTFYFSPWFNLFFQARYVNGKHYHGIGYALTGVRLSGGLGFHLNTRQHGR